MAVYVGGFCQSLLRVVSLIHICGNVSSDLVWSFFGFVALILHVISEI